MKKIFLKMASILLMIVGSMQLFAAEHRAANGNAQHSLVDDIIEHFGEGLPAPAVADTKQQAAKINNAVEELFHELKFTPEQLRYKTAEQLRIDITGAFMMKMDALESDDLAVVKVATKELFPKLQVIDRAIEGKNFKESCKILAPKIFENRNEKATKKFIQSCEQHLKDATVKMIHELKIQPEHFKKNTPEEVKKEVVRALAHALSAGMEMTKAHQYLSDSFQLCLKYGANKSSRSFPVPSAQQRTAILAHRAKKTADDLVMVNPCDLNDLKKICRSFAKAYYRGQSYPDKEKDINDLAEKLVVEITGIIAKNKRVFDQLEEGTQFDEYLHLASRFVLGLKDGKDLTAIRNGIENTYATELQGALTRKQKRNEDAIAQAATDPVYLLFAKDVMSELGLTITNDNLLDYARKIKAQVIKLTDEFRITPRMYGKDDMRQVDEDLAQKIVDVAIAENVDLEQAVGIVRAPLHSYLCYRQSASNLNLSESEWQIDTTLESEYSQLPKLPEKDTDVHVAAVGREPIKPSVKAQKTFLSADLFARPRITLGIIAVASLGLCWWYRSARKSAEKRA